MSPVSTLDYDPEIIGAEKIDLYPLVNQALYHMDKALGRVRAHLIGATIVDEKGERRLAAPGYGDETVPDLPGWPWDVSQSA